jgi:hypothetical protein
VSDISFHFTLLDFLLAAPIFGWPGLLMGGALGAYLWKRRRILGALIGGLLGAMIWFAALVLMF